MRILRGLFRLIDKVKRMYCRLYARQWLRDFGSFGSNSELICPFDIRGVKYIYIGNNVFVGPRVFMGAGKGAEICVGDDVIFGPEVKLICGDHRYDLKEKTILESGCGQCSKITINDDAWICAGVIILKGVTIGKGSIVGAGSVVTKNVPDYEIWAGNPANFIKKRFLE